MKLLISQHSGAYRSALSVGLAHDDVEQLEWEGVMRAAFKYDPTKPNSRNPGQPIKFSTYAGNWIWQMVSRARDGAKKAALVTESGPAWHADGPIGINGSSDGWDMIPAKDGDDPGEADRRDVLRNRVAKVLRQLPARYREVMELRYGLSGGEPLTLEQVGAVLGVTRERIRQMEKKCLERIRVPLQIECGDLLA